MGIRITNNIDLSCRDCKKKDELLKYAKLILTEIADTDLTSSPPDVKWLSMWRNNTKILAQKYLDKAGK